MKRPLSVLCLVLIILLYMKLLCFPSGGSETITLPEGKQYYAVGKVVKKDIHQTILEFNVLSEQLTEEESLFSDFHENTFKGQLCCTISEGEVAIGETVCLRGKFYKYKAATNPGQFDAEEYYEARGILGKLNQAVVIWQNHDCNPVSEALFELRKMLHERIEKCFSEKTAGVLQAVLLGESGKVEKDLKELYKQNGMVHILSISGLHISLLGMGLFELLRKCRVPVRVAAGLGVTVLVLYGFMVQAGVSAVRAIGMYIIHMLSYWCKRTYDGLTALGVMAVFILFTVKGAAWSSGFSFSFLSVLGILVIYPVLAKPLEDRMEKGENRLLHGIKMFLGKLLPGISITLATLPAQLWFLYKLPIWSVFMNLLVLPAMSILFIFGAVATLPGLTWLGFVPESILDAFESLGQWFSGLPVHSWITGKPQIWQVAIYYILLSLGLWYMRGGRINKFSGKRNLTIKCGIVAGITCGLFLIWMPWGGGKARVIFLDVGQGECCLVQTANGENYLFDCGSTTDAQVGERVLIPFLNYSGIDYLDKIFLSHLDTDHMNGIFYLLEKGPREGIGIGELILPDDYENCSELMGILDYDWQKRELALSAYRTGDGFERKHIRVECLHPNPKGEAMGKTSPDYTDNELSRCFYVLLEPGTERELSLLLTGDVEGRGEEELIIEMKKRDIYRVDILQVAHHGSRYATGETFLETVKGTLGVISCGKNNSYGHPHQETLGRMKEYSPQTTVFRTDECGQIVISKDKDEMVVNCFKMSKNVNNIDN